MIKIDEYELYCKDCEWVIVPEKDVSVRLSLNCNEYIFTSTCPCCKKEIKNYRKIT